MIIAVISLSVGTFLAALMVMGRKGKLSTNDYATLLINLMFAAGIVIVVGILFRMKGKKDQAEKK